MGYWIVHPLEEDKFKDMISSAISEIIGQDVDVSIEDKNFVLRCRVVLSGGKPWRDLVATFSLSMLPGCCGYLVSHETYVYSKFENKGIAQALQPIKEEMARSEGYTHLMCTTRDDNAAQIHILEKHGWEKIHTAVNDRTKNLLHMWVKHVG